ncbi:Cullin-domain-containing protein [Mycena venus]|uniref:Cullin-domain-containing protein n=1 Tax=Mycena venus TaxID=2733690 RepID=A0A8H7CFV5_9AGAR|nr:Cullin-domain-containing protein [Mycena venus]
MDTTTVSCVGDKACHALLVRVHWPRGVKQVDAALAAVLAEAYAAERKGAEQHPLSSNLLPLTVQSSGPGMTDRNPEPSGGTLARTPCPRADIPQIWKTQLEPEMTHILRDDKPLTYESHAALSAAIFNCTKGDPQMHNSKELHSLVSAFYAAYTAEICADSPDDDTLIVDYYDAQWDRFSRGAVIVDHLFDIMNRHWVDRERQEGRKDVQTIRNVALTQWKTNVFAPISPRLEKALGSEITQLGEIRTKFASENLTTADLRTMHVRTAPV